MGNGASCRVLESAPLPTSRDAYVAYEGSGPWWVAEPNAVVQPRLAKAGVAGSETPLSTLPKLLAQAAARKGQEKALLVERPLPQLEGGRAPPALPEDQWMSWTYQRWHDEARSVARALVTLGFQPFDSVNVWGFNSPEWHLAGLAAGFAGGKLAGLYPTDTPETAAFKVVHSGGAVVVVEDKAKLDRLVQALTARGDAKRIKAFVAYGFVPSEGDTREVLGCGTVPVLSWPALLELGTKMDADAEVTRRTEEVQPGHCAALIYTSGTTGDPKAVMMSHDNIIFETTTVIRTLQNSAGFGMGTTGERAVSYLPLSHVAGLMVDIATPVVLASCSQSWMTIYFARPYDLKVGTLKDRLVVARPTLFLGVPLVWEKIADRMRALGAETRGVKKAIATWAKGLGLRHAMDCQLGGTGRYPSFYGMADKLVLNKVKAALGLQECKFGFTGAAPIRVDTLEYFGSLGLNVNEVYGMSECCGGASASVNEAHLWGSCGFELPGVEVRVFKVDPADLNRKTECPRAPGPDSTEEDFQGEICFRGRNIMMGYLANPDLGEEHVADIRKKNAEAIDNEGWMHSGDKGLITTRGMLKITGRYKELIIGEGGENIAPVPIEDHVKKCCDGIAEVMMVGDKRKYNVALVTLKAVGANGETPGTDKLDAGAKRVNPEVQTISAALDDKVWIQAVQAAIESANNNPKVCINNAFKIQKFTILPTNFSEEKNELTPTKKLKRKVVETSYAAMIDKMYNSKDTYVRYQAESAPAEPPRGGSA